MFLGLRGTGGGLGVELLLLPPPMHFAIITGAHDTDDVLLNKFWGPGGPTAAAIYPARICV